MPFLNLPVGTDSRPGPSKRRPTIAIPTHARFLSFLNTKDSSSHRVLITVFQGNKSECRRADVINFPYEFNGIPREAWELLKDDEVILVSNLEQSSLLISLSYLSVQKLENYMPPAIVVKLPDDNHLGSIKKSIGKIGLDIAKGDRSYASLYYEITNIFNNEQDDLSQLQQIVSLMKASQEIKNSSSSCFFCFWKPTRNEVSAITPAEKFIHLVANVVHFNSDFAKELKVFATSMKSQSNRLSNQRLS